MPEPGKPTKRQLNERTIDLLRRIRAKSEKVKSDNGKCIPCGGTGKSSKGGQCYPCCGTGVAGERVRRL